MINEKSQYHLILTEDKQVLQYKYRNIPNLAMVLLEQVNCSCNHAVNLEFTERQ